KPGQGISGTSAGSNQKPLPGISLPKGARRLFRDEILCQAFAITPGGYPAAPHIPQGGRYLRQFVRQAQPPTMPWHNNLGRLISVRYPSQLNRPGGHATMDQQPGRLELIARPARDPSADRRLTLPAG